MVILKGHEIAFIKDIAQRPQGQRTCGSVKLLKIDRLIPEYIHIQLASMDTNMLTLTEKGWELARKYPRKRPAWAAID
jgi:hypothetical protein